KPDRLTKYARCLKGDGHNFFVSGFSSHNQIGSGRMFAQVFKGKSRWWLALAVAALGYVVYRFVLVSSSLLPVVLGLVVPTAANAQVSILPVRGGSLALLVLPAVSLLFYAYMIRRTRGVKKPV
ncbi:MAG: hypothetical protein ABUL72_02495, partial [Armatimonadota bacterium]